VRLLNAYGFTETSDDVAHHEVVAADLGGDRLPVGRAVLNCTLSVLVPEGDNWRAAAPDEPGELFVGGIPVGRGYPDDPAATRRAYFRDVLDPASPTGRLYRTGDAAVMTADGLLHCLGRLDRQAKISGVRIEPDEVEAVLSRHPKVTACAALVHRAGEAADLVACYVADEPATENELRAHVASALPPAMVPTRWLRMAALPLSTNGKVDHHALTAELAGTRDDGGAQPARSARSGGNRE